jgi:thiol-disulfide isomerase/thioredoxin
MKQQRFDEFLGLKHTKLFLLVVVFFSMASQAQNDPTASELKVGERMPDISLAEAGNVIYNKTGKTRFSDFKDKLIILDFWDLHCGSCIAGFPKMEKLQQQFKDSIQIILVNSQQNQKEIAEALRNVKTDPFPYDLLQIVDAKLLGHLFPYEFSSNQVWIDGEGIVRLNGHSMNNHAEKIRQLLAGKPITYVKQGKRSGINKSIASLFSLYDKKTGFVPFLENSIFAFNDEIGGAGGLKKDIIDSIRGTQAYRYFNMSLLALYNATLFEDFVKGWRNEICYPYGLSYINKYILKTEDTLRYTDYFSQRRDIDWQKSQYCYEQIVPADISDSQRRQYMLQDLNRYFGNLYGTEVQIRVQYPDCYVLVHTSLFQPDQIKSNDLSTGPNVVHFQKKGKNLTRYQNMTLRAIMQSYAPALFKYKVMPFLDESSCNTKVDVTMPAPENIKNIQELRAALSTYGLDIIVAPRKLDMVLLTDKSTRSN